MNEKREEVTGTQVTKNIWRGDDGKYRWIYKFDMRKNPTILISVLRVVLLAFGIVLLFMLVAHLIEGVMTSFEEYWHFYRWMLVLLAVLLVLAVIAYLIAAKIFGWSYWVLITMDEEGVESRYMKQTFEKAQALGWLTAVVGLAAGNLTTLGAGLVSATRDVSTSVFAYVRKVKAVKRRHVIYVNQLLGHNQVYAESEDFDFVRSWIADHCPNAKVRGK
ncbi:MAG: hypothetical protein J5496_06005 [Lachnospiraceae bacterium]|nr:hypothetical protein [Lachnospiraceae bacterium]